MRLVIQVMSALWCSAAVVIASAFILPGILCVLGFLLAMGAMAMGGSIPAIGVLLSLAVLTTYFCLATPRPSDTRVIVKADTARRMVSHRARRTVLHRQPLASPRITVLGRDVAPGRRRARVEWPSCEPEPYVQTPAQPDLLIHRRSQARG